jgi:putative ABC transport system permease protein
MSYQSVRLNKLRSFLSVLGISIGIFCVVSVYALVHSLETSLNNQFNKLGSDVVFVQKWPWDDFGNNYPWWTYLKRPQSSPEDARFLSQKIAPKLVSTTAYIFKSNFDLQAGDKNAKGIMVNCISYHFSEVQPIDIEFGRFFTEEEVRAGRAVAVIGNTLSLALFGTPQSVGKTLRIKNKEVVVVGVCEFQGSNMIGASADNVVYVSDQWGKNLISFQNANDAQILLKAAPGVPLEEVQFEARRLMRQIRRLKPQESDDFAVNKMSMITEAISSLFIQIRKIGIIIGGFAMVVGCFGVANIMFVSVKERTREIGIQKALGAKNVAISAQFLMESIWLSIAGGIIGLLAVQMVLWLLGMVVQQQFGNDVVLSLSPNDTLLGVITSVIVGLVAGIIPARSAARLNPVDAIRSS